MTPPDARPVDLYVVWVLAFGGLVVAFPFYGYLAFGLGYERAATADALAIHVTLAYWLGIAAAFLPLTGLKHWTRFQRIQTVCVTFMLASFVTHLSWELLWLILHEAIANARDQVWAYPWWSYIDGGDVRYYRPEVHFLMIEVLSVINGSIGLTGLFLLWRSGFDSTLGVLMCMSTAVTHTVLTWYYYGTEFLTGFDSVNTASAIDLWVKFIFLNGPWLVFPWLVLYWGYTVLTTKTAAEAQRVHADWQGRGRTAALHSKPMGSTQPSANPSNSSSICSDRPQIRRPR